jgi:hypothetical protein
MDNDDDDYEQIGITKASLPSHTWGANMGQLKII